MLLRISHTADDEAGRYEGIPLAFMSYAQRRVEWLVLAIPLTKRSQTLSCSGIIRTCCRCLRYYLTAKNTASPANSPSWLDLDPVPLLINGELPALTATTGAVYWPNRIAGGELGVRLALPSSSLLTGSQNSLYETGCRACIRASPWWPSRRNCFLCAYMNFIHWEDWALLLFDRCLSTILVLKMCLYRHQGSQ